MNVSQCFINLSPESEAGGQEARTCSSSCPCSLGPATNIIILHFWQFRKTTCQPSPKLSINSNRVYLMYKSKTLDTFLFW